MNRPRILCIGEVLWDLFPDGPRFGGATANFACHAAALGGNVVFITAVGDDDLGCQAIDVLQSYGVDSSLIQRISNAPTGSVAVSVNVAGKPTFTIHTNSAWDQIAWSPEFEERLPNADAFYFGTLGQRGAVTRATTKALLQTAMARGIPRILDVNLRAPFYDAEIIRESIAHATVLKLSDDELREVTAACDIELGSDVKRTLRDLLMKYHLKLVAMTRGSEGAILVSATETIDQPGIATVVRDTVGAGDAFTAAFTLGLLRQDSLATIARMACEVAAATCAHTGAVPLLSSSSGN